MSNWILEAKQEMIEKYGWIGDEFEAVILSHAPVVDAGKLAEKIIDWDKVQQRSVICTQTGKERITSRGEIEKRELAQLITDNIELDITWVDGKAEWGTFYLATFLYLDNKWHWQLELYGKVVKSEEGCDTQELAEQACEKALRRILSGVKE